MAELDQEFWARYMRVVYDKGVATSHPYKVLQAELVSAMVLESGMSVLDMGCGTGNLIQRMLEDEPCLERIYGIELSKEALGVSAKKVGAYEAVSLVHGDACSSQTLDGFVDRVVSMNVLYAVDSPGDFIRNARSSLVPGGQFICTNGYRPLVQMLIGAHDMWLATQATSEERMADDLIREFRMEAIRMNAKIAQAARSRKAHFWSPEKLAGALEVSGFEVLEMRDDVYAGINTFFVARAI